METLYAQLLALAQVIVIDVVLAGDNAIVVGMAAARVPREMRARVIFWGIAGAVVLRIAFAALTVQLLAIVGLTLAGGILLMWVCWKMYRELVKPAGHDALAAETVSADTAAVATGEAQTGASFRNALSQIIVADVSMSLDNILAVAGASHGHTWVLVLGLAVGVTLMAVAAAFIAKLLARFPWISWIGLLIVLYVALGMIWHGAGEIACAAVPQEICRLGLIDSVGFLIAGRS